MRRRGHGARRVVSKSSTTSALLPVASVDQLERIMARNARKVIVTVVTGATTEYQSQAFLGQLNQTIRQMRARGMTPADSSVIYLHATSEEIKNRLRRFYAKTGPSGGFCVPSAVIFHGKTHIRTFTEREVPKLLAVVSEEARTRYEQAKAKKMPFVKRAAWVAKRGAAAYAAWYTYRNVVPLALLAFENNVVKASFWNRFKDRSKKHLAHPQGGDERANVAESMKVLRRAALASDAEFFNGSVRLKVPPTDDSWLTTVERKAFQERGEARRALEPAQVDYNKEFPTRDGVREYLWGKPAL